MAGRHAGDERGPAGSDLVDLSGGYPECDGLAAHNRGGLQLSHPSQYRQSDQGYARYHAESGTR